MQFSLPRCGGHLWRISQHEHDLTCAQVFASDDGGKTWSQVATVGPMMSPELIACASGVYMIGSDDRIVADNNVTISRMLEDDGSRCGIELVSLGFEK